jgi:hypothetical protein
MRARNRWMVLIFTLVLAFLVLAGIPETQAQIPAGNHYKCYEIINPPLINVPVNLSDQFGVQNGQAVRPRYLCNPVKKNGSPVPNPNLHYVCYDLTIPAIPVRSARITNQFHTLDVRVQQARLLCLPSSKVLLTTTP